MIYKISEETLKLLAVSYEKKPTINIHVYNKYHAFENKPRS